MLFSAKNACNDSLTDQNSSVSTSATAQAIRKTAIFLVLLAWLTVLRGRSIKIRDVVRRADLLSPIQAN